MNVDKQTEQSFGENERRLLAEQKRLCAELDRYRHQAESLVEQRTSELERARAAAEAANRAKSAFLANMSHEIRTPLTAIVGFAESMLDSRQTMAERIEAIHTIIHNGRHLQSLISDILDLSKIEAERIAIERTFISFPDLLADVRSLVLAQIRDKGLDFNIHYLPPLPQHIESDPTRVKQILINLLGNAVKFTPPGGAVRLLVSLDVEQEQVMFSIQDTGTGIAENEIEHLFEPFVQADAATTRRFGGTGLGLTIARTLARCLGGDVRVISEPNQGSLFVLTLATGPLDGVPLLHLGSEISQASGTLPTVQRAPRRSGRVLVAEDHLDSQRLISLLIRRTGAEVVIAGNGQEAVEQAQVEEYDLVLMDMQMPVMSGLDAAALLRLTGFDRPIVALTANATEADKTQTREAGCDDFLIKPIDQKAFFAILERYLPEGQRPAPGESVSGGQMDLDDNPEFLKMRESFLRGLPEQVAKIETAFRDQDWEGVRSLAHQLKGVGGTFGLPEATRIAGAIEFQMLRHDYAEVEHLVMELKELCPCSP